MSDAMSKEQFDQLMNRLERIEGDMVSIKGDMVRKSDVFQAVLTVQGFTAAIIVGCVVVLNALGAFGGGYS